MIAMTGTSHNESQIADTRNARATVGRACSGNSSPSRLSVLCVLPPAPCPPPTRKCAGAATRAEEANHAGRQHDQRKGNPEKEDADEGGSGEYQHRPAF